MKQRTAVFNAVINVCGEREGKYELTESERDQVIMIVSQGIESGEVDFSDNARAKYDSSTKVRTYTVGLVNNWLRKDTRLNGGEKYRPKNPGSRMGQGDAQLKALKALVKQSTDPAHIARLEQAIEQRKAEIQAERAKSVEVDYSLIDPDLLEELGINQ